MHELILFLASLCPAVQAERDAYTVCYDTQNQRPLWTIHTIQPSTALPRRKHWRKDHQLNSRSANAFTNSGFHRGHLVAAADVPDSADAFLTSNAVPQNAALNTGPWRKLENLIRKHNHATVITGAIYADCGSAKIDAPCHLFKIALLPNGEIIAAFHHNAPKSHVHAAGSGVR